MFWKRSTQAPAPVAVSVAVSVAVTRDLWTLVDWQEQVEACGPDEAREQLTGQSARPADGSVDELAAALGRLPVALAHAASQMAVEQLTCEEYLHRYTDALQRIGGPMPAGDPARPVAATLLLALEAVAEPTEASGADVLAAPAKHPWLVRTGLELLRSGLDTAAATFWSAVAERRTRHLGMADTATLAAYNNLATALRLIGRTGDAVAMQEHVVSELTQLVGADHRRTLAARTDVARAYQAADRLDDAIEVHKDLLDRERPEFNATDRLHARVSFADALREAGRHGEAAAIGEPLLDDLVRHFGPEHPDTVEHRIHLAADYRNAGRTGNAVVAVHDQVGVDAIRIYGLGHPIALQRAGVLGSVLVQAGRLPEAVGVLTYAVNGYAELDEADDPEALVARANLAAAHWEAEQYTEAADIVEQLLPDFERVFGPDHPKTVALRDNLATARPT